MAFCSLLATGMTLRGLWPGTFASKMQSSHSSLWRRRASVYAARLQDWGKGAHWQRRGWASPERWVISTRGLPSSMAQQQAAHPRL